MTDCAGSSLGVSATQHGLDSTSTSSDSSSSCCKHGTSKGLPHRGDRTLLRSARAELKKAHKEAKRRYKAEVKTAKKEWKRQKRAWKVDRKMNKHRPSQEAPLVEEHRDAMDISQQDAVPSAEGKSPLEVLAEMGFENIEQNAQLLTAHAGNVQKTIEALLQQAANRMES